MRLNMMIHRNSGAMLKHEKRERRLKRREMLDELEWKDSQYESELKRQRRIVGFEVEDGRESGDV